MDSWQKERFGIHKKYGFDPTISVKPKLGDLNLILPSGEFRVLEEAKPFPLLQSLKREYITGGIPKGKLKITYTKVKCV